MKDLIHLLGARALAAKNVILHANTFSRGRSAAFLFFGGLCLAGLYAGFVKLLTYCKQVPLIGPLLITKLVSITFLTFFSLLVLSALLTAFSTLYFGEDVPFLLGKPLSFESIFAFKFLETSLFSSWMIALAFLPFLLAYRNVFDLGPSFVLGASALFVPFLLCGCALGTFACLILMRLFPSKRTRDVVLVAVVFGYVALYVLARFSQPENLLRPDERNDVLEYVATLSAPTAYYLPSFWMSAVFSSFTMKAREAAPYGILLLGSGALSVWILLAAARALFYPGFCGAQTSSQGVKTGGLFYDFLSRLSISGEIRPLFLKDVRLFLRDTNQWSQLLLLSGLICVYLFNIYKLPLDTLYLKSLISFLNIGLAGFVLAAVALRFVFPQISLEQKAFWVIRASPISLSDFMREKFWVALFPLCALAAILVWVSNALLGVDPFVRWVSLASAIAMSFGLTGLGIGMGAMFPRFDVDNIAEIESSQGGILYMLFALVYVGLNLSILAGPAVIYFRSRLGWGVPFEAGWILGSVILFLALHLAVTFLPLRLGLRALERLE